MVHYVLESGISLALLTTVYVIFLRKETFFRQNRVFLLGSILFSLVLPLVKLPSADALVPVMLSEVMVTPYRDLLGSITVYANTLSDDVRLTIGAISYAGYIYLTGVLFFLLRLVFRLIQIGLLIKRNEAREEDGYKLVVVNSEFSPFSFLNYIFISSSVEKENNVGKMLMHELEHVKQGHTIDVLLLEVLTVFQWFNPFLWLLKSVVRENHEYLADRVVLAKGVSAGLYKQLLLDQIVGQQYMITNSFNYSLIKKRMKMMSKIKSPKMAGVKYLAGFVIAFALIVAFGCEQTPTQKMVESEDVSVKETVADDVYVNPKKDISYEEAQKKEPVFYIVEKIPEYPGGKEALDQFIQQNLKYPVEAQENGIQGRVYVTFIVSSTGDVTGVKLARGVDPLLDAEAIRVVKAMPRWQPGQQRGKDVSLSFTMPINFALK